LQETLMEATFAAIERKGKEYNSLPSPIFQRKSPLRPTWEEGGFRIGTDRL